MVFIAAAIAKPILGAAVNIGLHESFCYIGSKVYDILKSLTWKRKSTDEKWDEYQIKLHECINTCLNAQLEYEQMADKFSHDQHLKEHFVLCSQWCHAMAKYLLNLNERTQCLYVIEDKEIEGFTVIKPNSVSDASEKNTVQNKDQIDVELCKLEWLQMLVSLQKKLEKILASMRENSSAPVLIGKQVQLFELGNKVMESKDNFDLENVTNHLKEITTSLNEL